MHRRNFCDYCSVSLSACLAPRPSVVCTVLSCTTVQDPAKHAKAWEELRSCHGVLVPGGFGSRGLEGKIQAIRYARWVGQSGRGREADQFHPTAIADTLCATVAQLDAISCNGVGGFVVAYARVCRQPGKDMLPGGLAAETLCIGFAFPAESMAPPPQLLYSKVETVTV